MGLIEPKRGDDGRIRGELPQRKYRNAAISSLHVHGAGPFCRFTIARKCHDGGIYMLSLDDSLVYVGECGLRSEPCAQSPSRCASNGIDPPPEKGS